MVILIWYLNISVVFKLNNNFYITKLVHWSVKSKNKSTHGPKLPLLIKWAIYKIISSDCYMIVKKYKTIILNHNIYFCMGCCMTVMVSICWRLALRIDDNFLNFRLCHLSVPEHQLIQALSSMELPSWWVEVSSNLHDAWWRICVKVQLLGGTSHVNTIMIHCDSVTVIRTSVDHSHVNPSIDGYLSIVVEITLVYWPIIPIIYRLTDVIKLLRNMKLKSA